MSERCFVCGEDNPNVLHDHHLVPRRYDGDEDDKNIYTLCANCHEAIEKMYNADFYKELGVGEGRVEKPAPSTIPAQFTDEYIEQSSEGWVEKDDLREVYRIYCRMHGLRTMANVAFGRAINSLAEYDAGSGQRSDGDGGILQVYNGIELTREGKSVLNNYAERQSQV